MKTYPCPACGAEITLRSAIAVTAICPYCRTLVVRHDDSVDAIGKVAVLPDDISPFQIGTTGKDGNVGFVLIGRSKVTWADGAWNEWLMLLDTGEQAWLAEAQGSLTISRAVTAITDIKAEQLAPGQTARWKGTNFTVNDRKDATYAGYEGEFPRKMPPLGTAFQSIDLVSQEGAFLNVAVLDGQAEFYAGDYVAFNDCSFANLRDLPGWDVPRPNLNQAARGRD